MMASALLKAFAGKIFWEILSRRYSVDQDTVCLVLPEDDAAWNQCAWDYLPYYVHRKVAKRVLVLEAYQAGNYQKTAGLKCDVCTCRLPDVVLRLLMQYYMVYRFTDNIAFLYLDWPQDNMSARILAQGNVARKELICLGFYHLREVPHGPDCA
ncbi:MAG: hypothetical protein ACI4OD_05550 [Selenomonas sp.]